MEALYNEEKKDEQLTPTFGEQSVPNNQNIVPTQQRINGGNLVIGEGNNVLKADDNGLYLGNKLFANAPFRVDPQGNVVANSLTLVGGSVSYGKTSFTDSTNAGYYLSSGGWYVGAAADATYLKYTLGTGTFDFSGTHSGGSVGGQSVTNVALVSTSTADSVPTGLSCSSTTANVASDGSVSSSVVLTWTAIATSTFDHYLIRYKKASYTYYTYIPSNVNTITIEGLTPNVSYNFGVASVNRYGSVSSYSVDISQTTATSTTAPATVTSTSATGGIQYVILEWTHNTDTDLASYNIYRNTANDSSTATLIGNSRTNYFVDGGRTGGTVYYYWVKAVNTSGLVSTSFSTVQSATPRNVESADVVSVAANKILVDGVVYLSNWRHSSDLTKIDGGDIYANSITTTQLNFTPVQSTDVIAKINASAEGITIDADNLSINAATTFSAGYDPTSKVAALAGSYNSASSGARVRIFPDANTGLQIIDDAAGDVFKALVGGTDVGDVIVGNYAGGQGLKYDKSANTTTFAGQLSAASGTLGAISIGANAWNVDSSGNMWWGSTGGGFSGAFNGIDSNGATTLESLNTHAHLGLKYSFTAGENLTATNAVRLGYDTTIEHTYLSNTNETSWFQIANETGNTINTKYMAQAVRFTSAETIKKINLKFLLSPQATTGRYPSMTVTIQADNSGSPSGSALATSGLVCQTIYDGTTGEVEVFTLTSPYTVTANTTYWIVLELQEDGGNPGHYPSNCGDAQAGNEQLYIRYDNTYNYSSTYVMKYKNTDADSWTDGGVLRNLYFSVIIAEKVGSLYKADATTQAITDHYLGFIESTVTAGTTGNMKIATQGIYNRGSLTAGSVYYLSDTAGAIGTSAGTISKKLGIALSTTNLYLY